jgi:two-component system sensor histidine kinase HydH
MNVSGIGRWARWGWLATTIAMALALLVTSWASHRRIVRAANVMNRGQSEVLLESVRQYFRDAEPLLSELRLDSVYDVQHSAGIRYIGVFDTKFPALSEGRGPIAEAGTPLGDPRPPIFEPNQPPPRLDPVNLGERIRAYGGVRMSGQDSLGNRTRRGALVVLEFEPQVAQQLQAQATRTFALAVIVTIVMMLASFFFWRLSMHSEANERRLEHQARLGMLGEMSAVLAHEIRNPLASLKGNAQLLAERMPPEGAERRRADRVVQEAERLEALTSDLLDFARSGPIELSAAIPAAVLRASVEEVGSEGFDIRTDEAPASWKMDETRMRQALTNVLRNARQASPDGVNAEAAVAQRNGHLVFTVRDRGPGIAPGDEKKIFSPFYTTRTNGTGLGLAVAQRIAEMHMGEIVARTHPDGGAEFRIEIPST